MLIALHGRRHARLDGGGPADVADATATSACRCSALPLAIVALVVFAIWPAGLSLAAVSALFALAGVGIGPMYPATTVIIQNAVLPHQLGIATGTLNFFRSARRRASSSRCSRRSCSAGVDGAASHARQARRCGSSRFRGPFRLVFIAAAVFLALALVAIAGSRSGPARAGGSHDAGSDIRLRASPPNRFPRMTSVRSPQGIEIAAVQRDVGECD